MIITVFDARRIQTYLFGSNRLAENIGASYLVNQALHEWPLEAALQTAPGQVNPSAANQPIALPGIFENQPFKIELLYSAGGNALFVCKDIDIAKQFATNFSKILHERVPGLEVACNHHEIKNTVFNLGEEIWNALSGMAKSKNSQLHSAPFTGAGVTERCASGNEETAVFLDTTQSDRFLSPAAFAKIENKSKAKNHLTDFLHQEIPNDCDLPSELDDLGRSRGEKSFVGVVHIDGNGIGKSLQAMMRKQDTKSHADRLKAIRDYSTAISDMGSKAVRSVMEQVSHNWDPREKKYAKRLLMGWDNDSQKMYLPFRPLVYGGDDITFVCDGRIALDLAVTCLKAFNDSELRLHACAGIALVKSHYPFFRAYRLAEELCRNAKKAVIEQRSGVGSAMDWQIVSGGPMRSIDSLREREYTTQVNKLTCRPYFVLPKTDKGMNDWESFRNDLLLVIQGEKLTDQSKKWAGAHSRLKSLSPHLVRGPDFAQPVLAQWKQKGYELPEYCSNNLATGFYGAQTPFLDALELLDFLVPIE